MDTITITAKDARNDFANILENVSAAGKVYLVTKFGKTKAMIIPYSEEKAVSKDAYLNALQETFGMWKGREEMTNSVKWVQDQRAKEENRYAKMPI